MVRSGDWMIDCLVCPESPAEAGTSTMIAKDFPLI
jgi:hypothetical protein